MGWVSHGPGQYLPHAVNGFGLRVSSVYVRRTETKVNKKTGSYELFRQVTHNKARWNCSKQIYRVDIP
jgi:hypothetical protein